MKHFGKIGRYAEFLLLYICLPAAVAIQAYLSGQSAGTGGSPKIIPVLLAASAAALFCLVKSAGFDRSVFFRKIPFSAFSRIVLPRFIFFAFLLTAGIFVFDAEAAFSLPRENPWFWLLVIFLYPIVSVVPQGILYRVLYEYRYAGLFPQKLSLAAGAAVFSFAHLVFGNIFAILFTFIGGLMFLSTYRKTESLLVSCVEHALYGDLLFTIGWGSQFFYAGTIRTLGG